MKDSATPAKTDGHAPHSVERFPIVGIGASAGGLEALEDFFSHTPADSGMAFVVVQHLDPTHKGMMPELLQRVTSMPVTQVRDRMKVKRDCIYVIPPNKDLSLLHGVLHLIDPVAPRGLRLPIDFFLRSLADDQHERAIAVILSGMGSDGTLGLRAIKEFAGLVLVQNPATAKFDGMPGSAINAGLADIVAEARDLPQRILDFLTRVPQSGPGKPAPEPESPAQKSGLDKIVILLRARTGHDFSSYKKSTIYRRIERRMGIHQLARITDYVRYLRENPQEVDLLFKELLIGVTCFFRDPDAWNALQKIALPQLLTGTPAGHTLRAWVAGCSTGEEAYSLAIAFREVLEQIKPVGQFSLQIFATDLDPTAIETARQGRYPANIAADLSPERLNRYFVEDEGTYREVAQLILNDVGLEVEVAENGVEAVEMARRKPCALILMDMQMPKMDGLEATRQIRATEHGARIPIIATTANAFPEDRTRCLQAGMNDFIAKPVDPDVLFTTVLHWLTASPL